ncbi:RsmB/NOP family class I SAM-dependent RNA methyltransferase [Butyrivibrio sp. MC2013]|uniref:RsmB/NOP family class I SAM-dependent RNA methyltransferase n=1 Tax=Butyrivibrio sp. MC2013 TaxID=1280686 RepID=UPI00047B6CDB|nr:RsmF rRNA methyltransferase first C-terminal domain-containing protein [Butyrivibrio sp. MC2013]
MKKMLGEDYEAFMASLDEKRVRALRLNPLKEVRPSIALSPIPWEEQGFIYEEADEPGKSPYHMAGAYYIQEPSAMAPVSYLDPRPGEKVLDLCAAPGGKSTQIAGRMKGEGILVTNEIVDQRADILSENIERMAVANAMVVSMEPDKLAERFEGWFDKILVDAPCSGEGMFRKNEEAANMWSPDNVHLCADRQDMIMDMASRMLSPGGMIVYSTCTFAPDEDEGEVARFLIRHPEFETIELKSYPGMDRAVPAWAGLRTGMDIDPEIMNQSVMKKEELEDNIRRCIRLWPHHIKGEGHFVAAFRRRDEEMSASLDHSFCPGGFQSGISYDPDEVKKKMQEGKSSKQSKTNKKSRGEDRGSDSAYYYEEYNSGRKQGGKGVDKKGKKGGNSSSLTQAIDAFYGFAAENLSEHGIGRLKGKIFLFGDRLFLAPDIMPSTDMLRVKRPGLHLGTMIKGRFEPSHSLALYLTGEDVLRTSDHSVDSPEIRAYTEGMTVDEHGESGWTLMLASSCSIGWGKSDGKRIKNHYPKGLRIHYGG